MYFQPSHARGTLFFAWWKSIMSVVHLPSVKNAENKWNLPFAGKHKNHVDRMITYAKFCMHLLFTFCRDRRFWIFLICHHFYTQNQLLFIYFFINQSRKCASRIKWFQYFFLISAVLLIFIMQCFTFLNNSLFFFIIFVHAPLKLFSLVYKFFSIKIQEICIYALGERRSDVK